MKWMQARDKKWMQARDKLIAQTLAIVQSVTGRKENAGEPRPLLVPEAPKSEAKIAQAKCIETPEPPRGPNAATRPSDLNDELKARVASFRAHQERFNREREEYFSTTLARLRAAIKDAPLGRPGSGK